MSGTRGGGTNRSVDDVIGAATRDLRAEVDRLDIEPFRPTSRRSPLVAGIVALVAVGGVVVWATQPNEQTVVSGPSPTAIPAATSAVSGPVDITDSPATTAEPDPATSASVIDAPPGRDLDAHVPGALDRPAANETVVDPAFGQLITRVTDSAAGEYIAPLTTLTSAFNVDETKLLVYRTTADGGGEHRVLDLTDGTSVTIDIAPSDIEDVAWSATEPNTLVYVDGIALTHYDVGSQTAEVVRTFEECDGLATAVVGNGLSADGDVIALACLSADGDSLLAYRFSTDEVVAVPGEQNPELFTQAPRVAPSGERFVFPTAERLGTVLDAALQPTGVEIDPLATTARDATGVDLAVGPSFGGDGDLDYAGSLVATDLATGAQRVLVAPGAGTASLANGITVSASGGLVVFSTQAPSTTDAAEWATYDGEVVLVDLTGTDPIVTRLAHNRTSTLLDYWSSTFVSVSPSGDRVAFSSDWGTGDSVDTYVIDVRRPD